jgi:hypothetical protein
MTKTLLLVAGILALALLTFGCKAGGGNAATQTPGDASKTGADPSAPAAVMFAKDVQPLLTRSCALSSCHGAAKSAGMQLTAGMAYGNIVNVKSTEVPQLMRVKPSKPDSSYAVMKLEGRQTVGAQMPLTGGPLPAAEIQAFRDWIKAGAKND